MAGVSGIVKTLFRTAGLDVSWRDPLAEQIDASYLKSPYLPPIYRQSFGRLLYFREMFERSLAIQGDLVECGVSIGTGILNWSLLADLSGTPRTIYGFDSFEGFPASIDADRTASGGFTTHRGDYASAPELVLKVLEHGRVSPAFVREHVRLVRGFFDASLPHYDGRIALLHLDCDLYESYLECFKHLYDKVVPGGLVLFDEYEDETFPGAKKAIDEFLADKPEKPIPYNKYGYLKYHIVKA